MFLLVQFGASAILNTTWTASRKLKRSIGRFSATSNLLIIDCSRTFERTNIPNRGTSSLLQLVINIIAGVSTISAVSLSLTGLLLDR